MNEINDLAFSLKYVRNPNGNYTLLISHPNGTPNRRYGRSEYVDRVITNRERTREFVKWFRKSFKHIVTEFRGLETSYWYDTMRHFVAYEVPPKDFMLLKLAKETEMKELAIGYQSNGRLGYDFIYDRHITPSPAYIERQQKKAQAA